MVHKHHIRCTNCDETGDKILLKAYFEGVIYRAENAQNVKKAIEQLDSDPTLMDRILDERRL
ncbi:MAG: hypothetical protein WAM14_21780 [Candidatus Nitrosopolaris sp.]